MNTQIIAELEASGPMNRFQFIDLLKNKLQTAHTISELEKLYDSLPGRKKWGDAEFNVAVAIMGARKNLLQEKLEGLNCRTLAAELRRTVGPDGCFTSSWYTIEQGMNSWLVADMSDVISRILEKRFTTVAHGRAGFNFHDAWEIAHGGNHEMPEEDNDNYTRFEIAETKRRCTFDADQKTCSHM